MRFALSMPKVACRLVPIIAALLVVPLVGCGSPGADSPEAKEARQKRATAIREDEAQDKVKSRSGRKTQAGVMKSIKGRLGGDDSP